MSQESVKISLTASQAAGLKLSEYVHVLTIVIKCVNFEGNLSCAVRISTASYIK